MRHTRIYQASPMIAGEILTLDTSASQHLLRVLRLKVGEMLSIFNGTVEHRAKLIGNQGTKATVEIQDCCATVTPLHFEIQLAFAATRSDALDWIVQKGTELGVHAFYPLVTAHSGTHLSGERAHKRHQHLEKVIISACEQCGRINLPLLKPLTSFENLLENDCANHLTYLLDPRGAKSLLVALPSEKPKCVTVMSGPEGGFSDLEIEHAHRRNIQTVQLGPRILRAETAPLAAVALLQAHWGDWR